MTRRCSGDLSSYKARVKRYQEVVNSFGQLVNWGSDSLDGLEYICLCCNPTEDVKGVGLKGFGMRSGSVGPGWASRSQEIRLPEGSDLKIDAFKLTPPSTNLVAPFVPTKNPGWLLEREATYDAIRKRQGAKRASKDGPWIGV